jgi:hypothetical protein
MHEMWSGPDRSGESVWHVLADDKTLTLCGLQRQEERNRREPSDRHCFPCMTALQGIMA